VSRAQASSIEDKFVDAVRDALETAPDWSAEPVTILRRTVQGHIEMVKFDDSSYMNRAAYDLTANDLTVVLTNGEFLRVDRIRRILGQAAGCPIQGRVLCAVHSAALQREEARVVKKNVRSTQIATPNSLKPCTAKPCAALSIIVETRA
jgi:hypothetical protein